MDLSDWLKVRWPWSTDGSHVNWDAKGEVPDLLEELPAPSLISEVMRIRVRQRSQAASQTLVIQLLEYMFADCLPAKVLPSLHVTNSI